MTFFMNSSNINMAIYLKLKTLYICVFSMAVDIPVSYRVLHSIYTNTNSKTHLKIPNVLKTMRTSNILGM